MASPSPNQPTAIDAKNGQGKPPSDPFRLTTEHFKTKPNEETVKAIKAGTKDDEELNLPAARQSRSEDNFKHINPIISTSPMVKQYEKAEQKFHKEQGQKINPEDLKKASVEKMRAKVSHAESMGDDQDFVPIVKSGSEHEMGELNKIVRSLPVTKSYTDAERRLNAENRGSKEPSTTQDSSLTKSTQDHPTKP